MAEEEKKDQIEESPFEDYINPKRFGGKFWVKAAVIAAIVVLALLFKSGVMDKTVDPEILKSSLEIMDINSQWVESEKVDEKDFKGIILVPEFSFRFRNTGEKELNYVFLVGVFRLLNASRAMGEGYLTLFRDKPLKPGEISDKILVRSGFGYRATSKKAFELNSRKWRSAVVEIYIKSGNSGLVFLKSFYINRKIEGLDTEIKILGS